MRLRRASAAPQDSQRWRVIRGATGGEFAHPFGDEPISFGGRVLVPQRRLGRAVAETAHKFPGARTSGRSERIGEVAKVVQMQVFATDGDAGLLPDDVESRPTQHAALWPCEHRGAFTRVDVLAEVPLELH